MKGFDSLAGQPILALNCHRSRCKWVCGVMYPKNQLAELVTQHEAHREEDWDTWGEEPVYHGIRRWVTHTVSLPDGRTLAHWEFRGDGSMYMPMVNDAIVAVVSALTGTPSREATETTGAPPSVRERLVADQIVPESPDTQEVQENG